MADDKTPPNDKPDNQGPPPPQGAPSLGAAEPKAGVVAKPAEKPADKPAEKPADKPDRVVAARPAEPAGRASLPPGPSREDTKMARSTRTQSSWGSALTAGVVGGAVVALAAGFAWITLRSGDEGAANEANARLAAVELRVGELAARPATPGPVQLPADLAGRLGRVEAAVAAAARQGGADPALAGRLTAAEAAVARLTEQLARADKRIDETAAARAAGDGAAPAPAAPGVQPAELDAVASRVTALERTLTALQQQVTQRANAPVSDKAVRLAVLTASLRTLVERSAPYGAELAAAKQLVSDPQTFGPLEPFAASGVPSALVLGRELGDIAPAMLKAGDLPPPDDYLERLQSQAEKLVRVRPVKDAPGSDLAAQIGRAEAKARQADLAGALAELARLPPAVRAPAEPWIKKAEARQAAVAAAQRVASGALAALATP